MEQLLPKFVVLPRHKLSRYLFSRTNSAKVAAVVSINNSGERPPAGFNRVARRLRLEFDDVVHEAPGAVAPTAADIRRLVSFAPGLRGAAGDVLVQCEAGISRSSAAVIVLAAELLGPGRESEAVEVAFRAMPHANPNRLMIALADAELSRGGSLVAALEAKAKLERGG